MRRFTLFAALAIIAGVSMAAAQSPGKDDQVLKDLVKQLTDAQSRYDAAVLDKLLAADYIEISPVGDVDPRAKVLGFYAPTERPDPAKMSTMVEAGDYSIRSDDKVAIVIVRLTFSITAEGRALPPRSMRATFVMRKEGVAWRFASAQYTGIRPPPPPGH